MRRITYAKRFFNVAHRGRPGEDNFNLNAALDAIQNTSANAKKTLDQLTSAWGDGSNPPSLENAVKYGTDQGGSSGVTLGGMTFSPMLLIVIAAAIVGVILLIRK